eukprot:COSAG02_NODE_2470_length_8748_cov_14.026477_8_plen_47_part_00
MHVPIPVQLSTVVVLSSIHLLYMYHITIDVRAVDWQIDWDPMSQRR